MSTEKEDHGKSQAGAQYESIAEMVAAMELDWDRLEELREERADWLKKNPGISETPGASAARWASLYPDEAEELAELESAAEGYDDADDARQRIEEDALSVEVRSDWVSPGEEMKAGEFRILLCTGGPAVQIRGELDQYGQPSRAWMEYQDWFTPWTQYFDTDQDTLLKYCSVFYFGEG